MKSLSIWAIVFSGILLIIFSDCNKSKENQNDKAGKDKPMLKVNGFVVHGKKLIEEISVSGTLLSFEEVELKPEISGRITKINLPEGKFVKSGTLLVKLFDEDLQANMKKLKTQLSIQEKVYLRQSELLKVNGISQNEYDLLGLQISGIKADIEYQKAMIRKTEIFAPFDGIVGLRNISLGAFVNSGTVLTTFKSNNKLKLDFSIPEKYSSEVKTGTDVNFKLNNSDKVFKAKVIATETSVDKNTRNLKVRAIVNNNSPLLIPGSFANVELKMREHNNALLIPTSAIIANARKKNVIISEKGMAVKKDIVTGTRNSGEIEVLEGIKTGDTVVTSGLLFLKEGMPVIFSSVTNMKQ